MTRDLIVQLFAQRQDAIDHRQIDRIVSQHAPECEQVSPMAGATVRGREAIGKLYEAWFSGFPDLVWTNEELIVDGDRVVQMTIHSGTDTGGFMGLAPTGKPFHLPIVWLYTIKDQQFTHVRPIYDYTGLLVQIGLLKAKPV